MITPEEKAFKDASLKLKEAQEKIREWNIRREEREDFLDTLEIIFKK